MLRTLLSTRLINLFYRQLWVSSQWFVFSFTFLLSAPLCFASSCAELAAQISELRDHQIPFLQNERQGTYNYLVSVRQTLVKHVATNEAIKSEIEQIKLQIAADLQEQSKIQGTLGQFDWVIADALKSAVVLEKAYPFLVQELRSFLSSGRIEIEENISYLKRELAKTLDEQNINTLNAQIGLFEDLRQFKGTFADDRDFNDYLAKLLDPATDLSIAKISLSTATLDLIVAARNMSESYQESSKALDQLAQKIAEKKAQAELKIANLATAINALNQLIGAKLGTVAENERFAAEDQAIINNLEDRYNNIFPAKIDATTATLRSILEDWAQLPCG